MSHEPPKKDPPEGRKNGASNGALNGAGHLDLHSEADSELESGPLDPEPSESPEGDSGEPLPAPPPAVAELCAACMRFIASKYKVALDGTPDTLSLVDEYVREARKAYLERPESIDLVAPAVGAYLGEVMRHELGAEWFAEGSPEGWRLYFHNVYLTFNPIGMGREAVAMEEAEGWHAHLGVEPAEREAIEERLAAMPAVDEEEYYLPTTRLEAVTAVVETLRARAEANGLGDVTFTREDYD